MRRIFLSLLATVSAVGGVRGLAAENLEMWYDAAGKPVAILPEEKPREEFVSTWERQAEERRVRAEGRRSSVRRSSGGRDSYLSEWADYDYGYVATPYYRYFQPRGHSPGYGTPCRWDRAWYGSYRNGGLRVSLRIH
jgi:hypothetical protein